MADAPQQRQHGWRNAALFSGRLRCVVPGARATIFRKQRHQAGPGLAWRITWAALQGQIYLGSDAFVEKMPATAAREPALDEAPRVDPVADEL